MSIQSDVNKLIGSIEGGALAVQHISQQKKISDTAELEKKKAEEEAKKNASYGNQLNSILGQAMSTNPKLKDKKYFDKALSIMEGKKAMMLAQRDATREYRNQFSIDSPEYKKIEAEGQARKEANFKEFEKEIANIGKVGRPKKIGG